MNNAYLKLYNGLARLKLMSKRGWQARYPRIVKIKTECECLMTLSGAFNKEEFYICEEECNIGAGEIIKVKCKFYDSAKWGIAFTFNNGAVARVAGVYVEEYEEWEKLVDMKEREVATFLTPLPSGYFYTKTMRDEYNLLSKNEGVGEYPQCRMW